MTPAPPPRRRAAAVVAAAVLVVLSLAVLPRAAEAQPCPLLDPDCVTSTTQEESTTTVEDTTTTEDTRVDEPAPSTTRARQRSEEEVVETTAVTITVTTLHDVLVPGDGTEGAESTTTTVPELASSDSGLSDESLILIIVAGLAMVALVVGILTWRYWTATRPTVGGRTRAG